MDLYTYFTGIIYNYTPDFTNFKFKKHLQGFNLY